MRKLAFAGALLIAVAVLALGCGKSQRTITMPGGKVTVKTDKSAKGEEHTVNFESKEGKASLTGGENKTITEAELGAPVYPGAKVQMSSKFESSKPGEQSVENHVLSTDDSFEKVADFYKTHLKNVSSQQSISQDDSRIAMFNVGKDKLEMTVQVSWDPKKKETMIHVMKQGK